ncbi:MAG TPA: hypothetical protein VLK82_21260 [Candidatus Tectomicrobia bacterium]|nr:hypothetical protein [Candidatus Tectomicrobia bacterium]
MDKRSCLRRVKARETESIPLVNRTPMALEIAHRDCTTSVCHGYVSTGGKMQ